MEDIVELPLHRIDICGVVVVIPHLLVRLLQLCFHCRIRGERFYAVALYDVKSERGSDNIRYLSGFHAECGDIEREHPAGPLEPSKIAPDARAPAVFRELAGEGCEVL